MTQALSNPDVVRDLHQIIDPCPGTDHRVVDRAPVDRGIGADLDIVLDHHAAELRHRMEALRRDREPEAFLTNPGARDRCRHDRRLAHATG